MITGLEDLEAARRNRERVAMLRAKEHEQEEHKRESRPVSRPICLTPPTPVAGTPALVIRPPTPVIAPPTAPTIEVAGVADRAAGKAMRAPLYRRDRPYKRGHYGKIVANASRVVSLYKSGYSMRRVSQEVGISVNTIKSILHEQPAGTFGRSFSGKIGNDNTWHRERTVVRALKGLAGSIKAHGDKSWDDMVDRTMVILQQYLESSPVRTVELLVGRETFSVDGLIKKALEVVLTQYLRLGDDFEEVSEGVFKYRLVTS